MDDEASDLKHPLRLPLHWRETKNSSRQKTSNLCVRRDEDTEMFLKIWHETNIKYQISIMFPALFLNIWGFTDTLNYVILILCSIMVHWLSTGKLVPPVVYLEDPSPNICTTAADGNTYSFHCLLEIFELHLAGHQTTVTPNKGMIISPKTTMSSPRLITNNIQNHN